MSLAIGRRALLQGAAAATLTVPIVVDALPADAELIALGKRFDTAWEHERAVDECLDQKSKDIVGPPPDYSESDRAFYATQEIADQIEAMQATTFAGCQVKARVCAWWYRNELADERLSVITDLLALRS